MFDFAMTDEQRSVVEVTRAFVERELAPHEQEVERSGVLRPELAAQHPRARRWPPGCTPPTCPRTWVARVSTPSPWCCSRRSWARASYALHYTCVARPSNILLAGHAGAAGALPAPVRPG